MKDLQLLNGLQKCNLLFFLVIYNEIIRKIVELYTCISLDAINLIYKFKTDQLNNANRNTCINTKQSDRKTSLLDYTQYIHDTVNSS